MRISIDVEENLYLLIKDYRVAYHNGNTGDVEEARKVEHEYLIAKSDEEAVKQVDEIFANDVMFGDAEYVLLDLSNAKNYGRKVYVI